MFPIQEVTDVDIAFPARVSHLMPKYEEIPDEFKEFNSHNKWLKLFSDWFYFGLKKLEFKAKDGVDQTKALRHIRCIMGSFEPKHEHKEAAVAFLFSEWFDDATWEVNPRKL